VALQYKDIIDDIIWVACCLGNYKVPLALIAMGRNVIFLQVTLSHSG